MKSKKKQDELDKQRIIILQTLEYLIEHYTNFFVLDDYDPSKEYYLQEKKQVEKYYKERRLHQIKLKLGRYTQSLRRYKDIDYQRYIEERTGYRTNLIDELRDRTNKILQNGIIANLEELADIEYMILICENDGSIDKKLYLNLITKYNDSAQASVFDLNIENDIPNDCNIQLKNQSDSPLRLEKGLIYKVNSPNLKNWIAVHSSGKNEFALTYIVVGIDGGSGPVYSAKGEKLVIKAYWENDSKIIIETSNKYETFFCHKKITTKFSNISLKYINNSSFI